MSTDESSERLFESSELIKGDISIYNTYTQTDRRNQNIMKIFMLAFSAEIAFLYSFFHARKKVEQDFGSKLNPRRYANQYDITV